MARRARVSARLETTTIAAIASTGALLVSLVVLAVLATHAHSTHEAELTAAPIADPFADLPHTQTAETWPWSPLPPVSTESGGPLDIDDLCNFGWLAEEPATGLLLMNVTLEFTRGHSSVRRCLGASERGAYGPVVLDVEPLPETAWRCRLFYNEGTGAPEVQVRVCLLYTSPSPRD